MLLPMGGKAERYFVPAVIGFAPVVFARVTWAAVEPTPTQIVVLYTALPIVVAELFVIVVALRAGLVSWIRESRLPRPAVAAIAVWLLVTIGTSLFVAPSEPIAVRWTVHWIIHLAFGFSVACLACRSFRIRDLVVCYLAGFVLYALLFLVFVLTSWAVRTDWVGNLPAAIHIRHVGIYAAAMTGMSIGAMAGARGRLEWGWLIAIATIGFALGVWTGSRGMVLSVIAASVIAAILLPAMRRPAILAAVVFALAVGIAAVAWLPVPNSDMMGMSREVAATTQHEVTTGRVQIWINVIHAIAHRPILGYGPGQMPIVAPFGGMGQPHNFILQLVLDWGAVGLICFLVAAFFYMRRAFPVLRQDGEQLAAPFMGMLSLLALSMIDAAMFHVMPVSIFAACAGMVAASWIAQEGAAVRPGKAPRTTAG
jgi:O-antigen ligase